MNEPYAIKPNCIIYRITWKVYVENKVLIVWNYVLLDRSSQVVTGKEEQDLNVPLNAFLYIVTDYFGLFLAEHNKKNKKKTRLI